MNAFTTALVPIIVLIILGYTLKRSRFLTEETWSGIEKLTYFILLPALLIRTLGKQTIVGTPWPSILVVVTGTLILSAAVLVSLRRIRPINDATFTSIFQGGVRFNTYITLLYSIGKFYFLAFHLKKYQTKYRKS